MQEANDKFKIVHLQPYMCRTHTSVNYFSYQLYVTWNIHWSQKLIKFQNRTLLHSQEFYWSFIVFTDVFSIYICAHRQKIYINLLIYKLITIHLFINKHTSRKLNLLSPWACKKTSFSSSTSLIKKFSHIYIHTELIKISSMENTRH